MAAITKADLTRYQEELAGLLRQLAREVDLTCRAFNRNKKERAGGPKRAKGKADEREGTIFRWINEGLQAGMGEQDLAELLRIRSVLAFIKGVEEPVARLGECVQRKIERRVLYSDAAVREVNDLFGKARFLLHACGDAVQTGNPILKAHVVAGVEYVLAQMEGYSAAHQERLAGGRCTARARELYEHMSDAFGTILKHLKEIASHVPGEMELETWACPRARPRGEEAPG